jgi:hypothetical protein
MWNILDVNCKATDGLGAPQIVHGLWYRYCNDCGVYHAIDSDTPAPLQPASILAFKPRASHLSV